MKTNYLFIADFSVSEIPNGGAEICDNFLISELRKDSNVEFYKSSEIRPEDIRDFDGKIIVSNFYFLSNPCKEEIENKDYVIYEHDHKYLIHRNPSLYPSLIAPKSDIINKSFYCRAKKVICQSSRHRDVVASNLNINNITSCGGNIWSEESLTLMGKLTKNEKNREVAILDSENQIKNTSGAISYCMSKKLNYDLIPKMGYDSFLERLSHYKSLVFLPFIFETLSRVAVEAHCLNVETICNNNVSFMFEKWSRLKGLEMIDYLRYNNTKIVDIFKW